MDDAAFDAFTDGLDYPMFILTVPASAEGGPAGCLIGFATQCSIEPVRFLVCVSKKNHTFRALDGAKFVGLHILRDTERDLAVLFGAHTGDTTDKFARCRWTPGYADVPILEGCVSWFVGAIEQRVDLGDHVGLHLDPVQVSDDRVGQPMTLTMVGDLDAGHSA
jgi:flavin reductase (DIM6/NTAB) family NADH-FMN oxidoreductase RutF